MQKAVESSYRAYVGKQSELLAHSQKSLLGTYLGSRIVIETWVAYSCKEHSIGIQTCLEGILREWVAHFVNGMSATDGFLKTELMAKLFSHNLHYLHTFGHNLGSDTVAGKYSY